MPLTTPNPFARPELPPPAQTQFCAPGGIDRFVSGLEASFPADLRGVVPELWARGSQTQWQLLSRPRRAMGAACGDLGTDLRPARVTIVGSRAASSQGLSRASALAHGLAAAGVTVISGGALGIDAAAHEGALGAGGVTYAVLGSGLLRPYPTRHIGLFAQIERDGLLVSPFPRNAPPRREHFPQRNEVMAALADAVVVIEAQLASGTRYTADAAARRGKCVLCFPDSPGTAALVAAGAKTIRGAADVLAHLAETPGIAAAARAQAVAAEDEDGGRLQGGLDSEDIGALSSEGQQVLAALQASAAGDGEARARDLSELSARTGLSAAACAAAVIELELRGECSRLPGGRYIGRAPLY